VRTRDESATLDAISASLGGKTFDKHSALRPNARGMSQIGG
jgi:hypothetical protein